MNFALNNNKYVAPFRESKTTMRDTRAKRKKILVRRKLNAELIKAFWNLLYKKLSPRSRKVVSNKGDANYPNEEQKLV